MSGRYEKELKIDNKIREKLSALPSIVNDYYYSLISSGKSYRTAGEYVAIVSQFINFVNGDDNFYARITSNDINKYIASLRTKTKNGKTERTSDSHRALHWSALNSFFQFLVPEKIKSNPVAATQRPKMRDNPNVTFLTPNEMRIFFNNIERTAASKLKNRDMCFFKLGFSTGLRISAILQIDVHDVDLENNQIKVTEKGDRDYYVVIGGNMSNIIAKWIEDRKKNFGDAKTDALFVSQELGRLSEGSVRSLIEKYSTGLGGKHITPHVMRHSCATNLYEKTGDIYLCAKQLHHKNVATTQRYAELSREKQQRAANILDDMI